MYIVSLFGWKMVMGDPLDPKTDIGTIISKSQYDRVKHYIKLGENTPGAKGMKSISLQTSHLFSFHSFALFSASNGPCSLQRLFHPSRYLHRYRQQRSGLSLCFSYTLFSLGWYRKVSREEIFGPVTCVIKFKDFDEAIRQANDTEYGLAATIWTTNLKTALNATKALKAGVVQVNQSIVLNPNFPVGGWKNSGIGREASLEAMIETYTKPKLISMNLQ